jgi:tetratricopeptide (TPR) repeat protein
MVTQIYTPPLKAMIPNQMGRNSGAQGKLNNASNTDENAGGQGKPGNLAALEDQSQKGVISIQSVVHDFQNTMNALGVSPSVRDEVSPYLQVVALQSQKAQPSSGLIKQNLKVAADTLDQFITGALGQKSNVVREWVDALLLQPISYHSDTPISMGSFSANGSAASIFNVGNSSGGLSSLQSGKGFSQSDVTALKQTLQQAKAASQGQQSDQAIALYQNALNTLGSGNYPKLQGRVLYQMGRTYQKSGDSQNAQTSYEQAATVLQSADDPGFSAKVYNSLGNVLQAQGDLPGAKTQYEQALNLTTLAGNTAGQSSVLNSLGSLSRENGKNGQAFSYYKQAFQVAQGTGNGQQMSQSLQSIAALYLDTGKPDKAFKALQGALAIA